MVFAGYWAFWVVRNIVFQISLFCCKFEPQWYFISFFIRSAAFVVIDGIALGIISFWGLSVYKSQETQDCSSTVSAANKYRTLVLVNIIIFGLYAVLCWIMALVMLCCGGVIKVAYNEHQRKELQKKMAKIPLAQKAIDRTTKKKFADVDDKEIADKCIICLCEFEDTDEIAELACSNKHIFHVECIQKWLETNLVCPTCKTPVKT